MGKWCYSLNGEEYKGLYDSKEDAIEEGNESAYENEKETFWVGKAEKTFVPGVDVDYLLERIIDRAEEEGGEYAEGYLDGVTNEQEMELEEKLNEVLHEWLDKHKHEVNFYSITGEEEITVVPID